MLITCLRCTFLFLSYSIFGATRTTILFHICSVVYFLVLIFMPKNSWQIKCKIDIVLRCFPTSMLNFCCDLKHCLLQQKYIFFMIAKEQNFDVLQSHADLSICTHIWKRTEIDMHIYYHCCIVHNLHMDIFIIPQYNDFHNKISRIRSASRICRILARFLTYMAVLYLLIIFDFSFNFVSNQEGDGIAVLTKVPWKRNSQQKASFNIFGEELSKSGRNLKKKPFNQTCNNCNIFFLLWVFGASFACLMFACYIFRLLLHHLSTYKFWKMPFYIKRCWHVTLN